MKKTITLFSFFLIFLLITINFSINDVNAVSYYNHIQNPSFLSYSNWCEDGGFESGEFDSGVKYGNWSEGDATATFSLVEPNTGVYCMRLSGMEVSVWYNLTDDYSVLGADIVSFTFYFKYDTENIKVKIHYSDYSFDFIDGFGIEGSVWFLRDVTSTINDAKYVVAFEVVTVNQGVPVAWLDDFVLLVDDGGGQDSLSMTTQPWYMLGTYPSSQIYISDSFGRLDNSSLRLSMSTTYRVGQYISYLDSNYIHFVSCYAYSALNASEYDMGITVTILYSDRTTNTKTKYLEAEDASWEYLNFGSSWIDSNKYIIQIRFSVAETDLSPEKTIYIDDVGLWASVAYGWSRFSFTLSPNPISKGTFDFEAYQNTIYTFCGYVYNISNGEMNENGTYSFTDSFGYKSGNLVNGQFNVTLSKRKSTSDVMTEMIGVTIVIPESGEVLGFTITGYWYKTEVEEPPEKEVEDFFGTAEGQNWMLLFIMLFVPTMVLVGGLKDYVPPHISFVCGFSLMVGVTRTTMPKLMPLWLLFVCVIVIALLLFATVKRWM